MNSKIMKNSKLGIAFGTVLLGAFTGCVGYVDEPHHGYGYVSPPSVYVEAGFHDDYVYYPNYQVYYSSTRHNYIYQDGRNWVTRSAPPRVSVGVLFASPSVRLDFHDSPSSHHSTVVQQYPRNWAPPGHQKDKDNGNHGNSSGHPGNGNSRGNERGRSWGGH
jgi:hypothetical protein